MLSDQEEKLLRRKLELSKQLAADAEACNALGDVLGIIEMHSLSIAQDLEWYVGPVPEIYAAGFRRALGEIGEWILNEIASREANFDKNMQEFSELHD